MNIRDLTPLKALELLREVVAEYGEDHTASCVYEDEGVPQCIAGHVYFRAGVTISQLTAREGTAANSPKFRQGLALGVQAADIIAVAQAVQDDDDTWGEALAAAEKYASTLAEGGVA